MVPQLTTSLTGPLKELERVILEQRPEIEELVAQDALLQVKAANA